jgi:hypothetical protein
MHDELNFFTLDQIYQHVMRDGEEKMSSLLVIDNVTASLKNLDAQMLVKKLIYNHRHYPLLVDYMPSAELQRYVPNDPQDDKPSRLLQTPEKRR